MYRSLLLACVLVCHAEPGVAQTTVPVDALAAYLHVDTADLANVAAPIDLAGLSLGSGQTIRLEAIGDWDNGPGGDTFATMLAVFSGSSILLGSSFLHRVPDAIDAGDDVSTPFTWPSNEPMEIDEDFAVDDIGVTIMIPPGATHLFVSTRDNYYRDNSDPDGDCGVKITLISQTAVAPAVPSHALSAYPNPFSLETAIGFQLRNAGVARITIHDVTGQLVRTLVAGALPAGSHLVMWDGRDSSGRSAATGRYFALLASEGRHETARVILVR